MIKANQPGVKYGTILSTFSTDQGNYKRIAAQPPSCHRVEMCKDRQENNVPQRHVIGSGDQRDI